jgi:ribosomal protein S10
MKNFKKKKVVYNIKVLSYDKNLLEEKLTSLLIEIKLKLNFFRSNIIFSIPSMSKKSCILRSIFVDNSSKEHLEIKKYQNIIKIEIFAKNDVIFILDNLLLNILKYPDLNIIYKKVIKTYQNKNHCYLS